MVNNYCVPDIAKHTALKHKEYIVLDGLLF